MGNMTKQGLCLAWMCLMTGCGDPAAGLGDARASGANVREEVPPPAFCDAVQDWDAQSVALEEEMLRLINAYRTSGSSCAGPTHPLVSRAGLICAARLHSKDMDDRDFYQHVNPDGEGPRERMEAVGYDIGPWGENILKGPGSAQEAMDGFMESPDHCSNIMSPELTVVGIGVHGTTWTQNFSN
jgi:uncharacterized protein YkwD